MTFTPLKHIVFVPGPSWGHLRPGMKTSLRMVEKFPNLFISLFVYHPEVPRAKKYLSAQPAIYSKRVRVVTASSGERSHPMEIGSVVELIGDMEQCFKLWITNELQQETVIQVEGQLVNPPSLIMEDVLNGGMSIGCRDTHKLPVVGWWAIPTASLLILGGHNEPAQEMGVTESLASPRVNEGSNQNTKAGHQDHKEASDRLVSIPGLPVQYEWEFSPQDIPFTIALQTYLIPRLKYMLKHINALVCCTTFEMEPISATSLSNTFNKSISPFFIGPAVDLVSPHQPDSESPVSQFLDRAYTEKGAHSVIYVAFGTAFFPIPESISGLMAALDEIPKAGFRFIFALSSAQAKVGQSWMDAHIQAGNAIFPEWTNQTAVLEHPAIHYFLSHGGWNSSSEALVRGVPMIFWPFMGDQPTNSMQIGTMHDCGFELLQVRTGPAKSIAYQNGREVQIVGTDDAVREEMRHILELSKGTRGQHQRMNARLLGKMITDSLGRGGSGDVGLEKFGVTWGLLG